MKMRRHLAKLPELPGEESALLTEGAAFLTSTCLSLSAPSLYLTIKALVDSSILLRLKTPKWQQGASYTFKTKKQIFFLRFLCSGNFHPTYCSQINLTIIIHCILTLVCLLFPTERGWPWFLRCLKESCYVWAGSGLC